MSHEIETRNGFPCFAYRAGSEAPWHRLGFQVSDANPNPFDLMSAAQCLDPVSKVPLFLSSGNAAPSCYATVRATDGKVLGAVGEDYTVAQPRVIADFLEPLWAAGLVTVDTAMSLRDGARVAVSSCVGGAGAVIVPRSDDRIGMNLLLATSHDGSMAFHCGFTATRVVCANTLAIAMKDSRSKLMRIRHTENIADNLGALRDVMNFATAEFEATAAQFRILAAREINYSDLTAYVREVFPNVKAESDETKKRESRILSAVIPLFESGAGNDMPGVRGTLWAAYNAVTDYLTHSRGNSLDSRVDSLWFGDSANVNRRALDLALRRAAPRGPASLAA